MSRTASLGGAAALLLAIAWTYAMALAAPFHFDDFHVIVDNPRVHGLAAWWASMPGIRPLLKLSYALNWSLSPEARGFHAVNLALHAINALLVWALAGQWLRLLAPRLAAPSVAAFGVALLFALHPAATEAVTYVSGRSQSLMALFYLAALWAHAWVAARGLGGAWRALSPLLFAAALGVRETAVTLPMAIFLLGWFAGRSPRAACEGLAGHVAVLVLALLAAWTWPGYDRFFATGLALREPGEQLLGMTAAHAYLVTQPLPGLQVNLDPELRIPAHWDARAVGVLLALLAAMAGAVLARRRWPWLGFAIGWYLLQLAPTHSLVPRLDLANDRHLYLALPGVALGLVVALHAAAGRRLGPAIVLAIALVLAGASRERNQDYRSELALWTATTRDSPGLARPWTNLGWARQQAGDPEGARRAYTRALAIDPTHVQARVNLSLLPRPAPVAPPPAPPGEPAPGRVASPSPL